MAERLAMLAGLWLVELYLACRLMMYAYRKGYRPNHTGAWLDVVAVLGLMAVTGMFVMSD